MMMNQDPDRANPMADSDQELCFSYLLGALSAEQTAEFEQRLAVSRSLGLELLQCSEIMVELQGSLKSAPVDLHGSSSWSMARAVALAASLLLMLTAWYSWVVPSMRADEELLIAQAWVSGSSDWEAESESIGLAENSPRLMLGEDVTEEEVIADETAATLVDRESWAEAGSLPEWLIAAVSVEVQESNFPATSASPATSSPPSATSEGDNSDG